MSENIEEGEVNASSTRSLGMMRHFSKSRSALETVTIEWRNIELSTIIKDKLKSKMGKPVYNERKILKGLNGEISSGELLAVLGPTGCGKSSFLNVISSRMPSGGGNGISLTGEVFINGVPRNDEQFRSISAYVLQDDCLYTYLTVHETLMLAANFFLPTEASQESKEELVDTIIGDLSLRKARDTRIGNEKVRGVSGGERRRTSIATQLISDPAVLFLDEPTSGLDSFQALSVMESMKALASAGRLVISVIHQPRSSIYNMFDTILLLSDGSTMFYGNAMEAVEYFKNIGYSCPENFNPSDYFLDIFSPDARTSDLDLASKSRIALFASKWEDTRIEKEKSLTKASLKVYEPIKLIGTDFSYTKLFRNFLLLCWRAFAEQSRDTTTLTIKLAFVMFFALIIGGIYSNIGYSQVSIQNRVGLMFFLTINNGFASVSAVLNTFPREKLIVNRERSGRAYATLSYFAAKVLVEMPLNVFPAFVYACIVYWLVGLNSDRFVEFFLILMSIAFAGVSFGLAVSTIAPGIEAATAIAFPLLVIGILFGGFYISVDNLPIVANWIPYFSIIRWGFEALCINEFQGIQFTCENLNPYTCIQNGDEELQFLSFGGHSTGYPIFGLYMCIIGFLTVAYFLLDRATTSFITLGHVGLSYASIHNKNKSQEKYVPVNTDIADIGVDANTIFNTE